MSHIQHVGSKLIISARILVIMRAVNVRHVSPIYMAHIVSNVRAILSQELVHVIVLVAVALVMILLVVLVYVNVNLDFWAPCVNIRMQ
jgi:hypothetical protein